MKILVCIKPDMKGQDIGPFESLALEAGLRVVEALADDGIRGCRLDAAMVGPDAWEAGLRRALGMGADRGIHIVAGPGPGTGGLMPPAAAAGLLAAWAGHPGRASYDLILTGVMSQDLMAGQTGPMLAEYLGIACATAVTRLDRTVKGLTAVREWEGGYREVLDLPLPALVSVQSGHYIPRYPALSHMLAAGAKPLDVIGGTELPEPARGIEFSRPCPPSRTREGRLASGSLDEKVTAFEAFVRERGLL